MWAFVGIMLFVYLFPFKCAPKTQVLQLWKSATLSILCLPSPTKVVFNLHLCFFFSRRGYNSCSLWHLYWLVSTCTSSPSCNDHFLPASYQSYHGGRTSGSLHRSWERHIPDSKVHCELRKSAHFLYVIRKHEISGLDLYKLWINHLFFCSRKGRELGCDVEFWEFW